MASCTKSKEVHPEIGDGNDEIVTVGVKDVHVEYLRTDHAELSRVVFHYSLADVQEFDAAEMTKRDDFFELTLCKTCHTKPVQLSCGVVVGRP